MATDGDPRRFSPRPLLALAVVLMAVAPAPAQVSDVPRILATTDGTVDAAAQIGRTLYVGGAFTLLGPDVRGLALVDASGSVAPGAVPSVNGPITRAVPDGGGGLFFVGAFTHVGGIPQQDVAHLLADGSLDRAWRVAADGSISDLAVAHGRVYLTGTFTRIDGEPRNGFAALDPATGRLLPWGAAVAPGPVAGRSLAISSTAVYVAGQGTLWGLDSTTGEVRFRRQLYVGALAASSSRVYVAVDGPIRVMGLDPLTGDEDGWTLPFGFRYIPATYGWDGTDIRQLVLDGGRLFVAGRFDPADGGPDHLALVDSNTGDRLPWTGVNGVPVLSLSVVGDVVVLSLQNRIAPEVRARPSGQVLPVVPAVQGVVRSVVVTARGIVLAGDLAGGTGTLRAGLAAFDLDTGAVTPWTVPGVPAFSRIAALSTDGTSLFAAVDSYGQFAFHKVDAASGAVVATLPQPATPYAILQAAAGDRVFVAANRGVDGPVVWAIDTASWSFVPSGIAIEGEWLTGMEVVGDRVYLSGRFTRVNGESRAGLAAVDRTTGAVLPWDPQPDGVVTGLAADATRVWIAGEFQAVAGVPRRGLAALDAATGQALAWNPDAPSGLRVTGGLQSIPRLVRAGDGTLLAIAIGTPATVSGQVVPAVVAFDADDGRRLPWASASAAAYPFGLVATADCVLPNVREVACHPSAAPPPSALTVAQSSATVMLSWGGAPGAPVSGWRLEVGRAEGGSDLVVLDLPASQTSIGAPLPPGGYAARVRALTAAGVSIATPDVSFAVGGPAAPLGLTAVVASRTLTLQWRAPSTGAPSTYFLEAGTSRGGTGFGVALPGGSTGYTLDLPPGEYWARLYALSAGVRSRPSPEVRIDVGVTQSPCASPPAAPVELRADVSPGFATVRWELAPGATLPLGWRVTIGSSPGASDLGSLATAPTTMAVAGPVPRGTYYVRVAGESFGCGVGPDSIELRVDVP